jgi:hypothetical protein
MRSKILAVCLWAAAAFGGASLQSRLTEQPTPPVVQPPAIHPVVAEHPAACCGEYCPCDGCECQNEECLAPVAPLQEPPAAAMTVAAPPAPLLAPVTGGVYQQPAYQPQAQYAVPQGRWVIQRGGLFGRQQRRVWVPAGYQQYQQCGPGG